MKSARAWTSLTGLLLIVAVSAVAQEKPRTGGILTWFDYGDP